MRAHCSRLLLCAAALTPAIVSPACNLGPFPNFLEQLDPLDPVEGEVKGWILAQDDQTQVLVLSESGRFLHSVINRDTSVELEVGAFLIEGGSIVMRSEYRYQFPTETGSAANREGAQSKEIDIEIRRDAVIEDGRLQIDGWGTFIGTEEYVSELDLGVRHGRGCLLKLIQLSIRTVQSRIRNLGGAGTVIYNNNESSFVGFLSGETTIVVENLLSPDTTIDYVDFQDFPEVFLDGSFVSHVNTAGDGTLDDSISFLVFGPASDDEVGLGGAGGELEAGRPVIARGRLIYGPSDPVVIEHADVAGGSYDFELSYPTEVSDNFSWTFLADLDLRDCIAVD